jgi:hypothetical protein
MRPIEFEYSREDLFYCIMGIIMTASFVAMIIWAVSNGKEWQNAVKRVESNTGCEYVGRLNDTGQVGFFDCNGVIETKRIK